MESGCELGGKVAVDLRAYFCDARLDVHGAEQVAKSHRDGVPGFFFVKVLPNLVVLFQKAAFGFGCRLV